MSDAAFEPMDLVFTIVFDREEARRIDNEFKRMYRKHRNIIRSIDKAKKRSRNNTHQKRFRHGRTYRTR